MAEVHARIVGALDSRADVPSDSDSDAPREGRGGDPLLDPEEDSGEEEEDDSEERDDDHRTLAEVLCDVQTTANMIFSQRDVASAETKLRALARVPAGLLSEETLDEHLDATLAACRDDESLGDRRLVFTPERKKRLRVRLHETTVRPPMRGVGSGGAQAPREPVAARARKTELQRERRRRERDRRRAATRASTDTPVGVSPVIETTSNAPGAMGARKGSVDVFPPPAAEVVQAAVANAAEKEEDAGARRTVAAPPRTSSATPAASARTPVGPVRGDGARSANPARVPFRIPWRSAVARGAANEPIADVSGDASVAPRSFPTQNVAAPASRVVEIEPAAAPAPARRIVTRGFRPPLRAAARGRGARGSGSEPATPAAPFKNPFTPKN